MTNTNTNTTTTETHVLYIARPSQVLTTLCGAAGTMDNDIAYHTALNNVALVGCPACRAALRGN